jgi:DNA-binding NarL/FixJ family response regulator
MAARIFIIEDQAVAARNISRILDEEGYEVVGITDDCQKAIDLVTRLQPDLVICSLYLKFAFNGEEIIKLIRSVSSMPFVFMSSFTHDYRLNNILRTKSEIYLCSPYTPEELIRSVNKLIQNYTELKSSNSKELMM